MMSVDSLSDSELRTKLAEHGYPVGPVTQTTRKILVKKLKNLIESRSGTASRHSLAARYSSDDTDDDNSATPSRKKKTPSNNRRQTMANPMPPPAAAPVPLITSAMNPVKRRVQPSLAPVTIMAPISPSKRRSSSRNSESKETPSDYDDLSSNTSNRTKNLQKKLASKSFKLSTVNDGLETGSDSDIPDESDKNYSSVMFSKETTSNFYETTTHGKNRNSDDVEVEEIKPYEGRSRVANSLRDETYTAPSFKPNVSPIVPVKEDTYKRDDLKVSDLLADYESPFLSEFTRRLSSQATASLPPRSSNKSALLRHSQRLEGKDNDTNGHFSSTRSNFVSTNSTRFVPSLNNRPRDIRSFKPPISTNKEEARNTQNMISMVLVIVLALFFGVLAIVYLGLGGKNEIFPSLPADGGVPLCSQSEHKPGVNCLQKENVDTVMQLLKKLRPILVKRAIATSCNDANEPPYITESEVVNMLKSSKVKVLEITSDLQNAQLLIVENPQWGISLVDVDERNDMSNQILDSMEKVFQARLEGKIGMVMLNVDLPIKCLVKQKVFTVLSTLLIVAIGVAAILGIYKSALWYLKYKKSTEREVFQLVSEIISMVELHHQNTVTTSPGGSQESYVAINHVRDNLIPPKDRKKMAGLWEKATKFLDENESRIRREVQQVSGEEFYVWRWLPNLNTSNPGSPVGSKKAKVWQGQAFETMEGSVNSLAVSPTPCLKIRHMFDPDVDIEDDWEVKVQDAILEKCGENVKVLHIRVDNGSREGCVYMKCMTHEDAGKAYRALHGCWFDGHLVTVKYLRLERYHERFPDSSRCSQALKPSNNQRLSMAYWQSQSEAN